MHEHNFRLQAHRSLQKLGSRHTQVVLVSPESDNSQPVPNLVTNCHNPKPNPSQGPKHNSEIQRELRVPLTGYFYA